MSDTQSFQAGIDFESILRIISKQVYETPLAFIRENVQNAVDAIRLQAHRDELPTDHPGYLIDVSVRDRRIVVRDNGIGMSATDLKDYFWTIGASGKRTEEARAAGCVGTFGIGGFANFGVCEALEVVSQIERSTSGTYTRLAQRDIEAAGTSIPSVAREDSRSAAPRGTIVTGYLREDPSLESLREYLRDFVRYVPTAVKFNGRRISGGRMSDIEDRENFSEISSSTETWRGPGMEIFGRIFEDRGHSLVASVEGATIRGESVALMGHLRFENGPLDVFKKGFKLCATQIGSSIGVSGRLDCERFVPTAGRDSLDAETSSLLGQIVTTMERIAIEKVLESAQRIAQHTRVFRYVVRNGLLDRIGKVPVSLADGTETTLGRIKEIAENGGVLVFFGLRQKQALNQIMQARGHVVVLLSSDRNRQNAERSYLQRYCGAEPFDGIVECSDRYEDLSRFERIFLSELELSISKSYEVKNYRLIAGKLTEDIPVFVKEQGDRRPIEIFVDVRHPEVSKLEELGYTQILYSLIVTFCQEYLGPSLKRWSPRFFGDGALNLGLLAKKRSELWVLMKGDIGILRKGGQRQIVSQSDVRVVSVGGSGSTDEERPNAANVEPRILRIVDEGGATGVAGFYIRLLNSAYRAYGDLLPACESRGVVWAGNRVLYVASDTVSASFQYEIRVDELVAATIDGVTRAEGAIQLKRAFQEAFGGLYFPVPNALRNFIVPHGDEEIRMELHCDWIDMRTAKHWTPREAVAQ